LGNSGKLAVAQGNFKATKKLPWAIAQLPIPNCPIALYHREGFVGRAIMASIGFKKPILVGGLGLTAGLWLLQSVQQVGHGFGFGSVGLVLLGGFLWFWQRQNNSVQLETPTVAPLTLAQVQSAINQASQVIEAIAQEDAQRDLTLYQQALEQLPEGWQRQELRVGVTGSRRTGKTQLHQILTKQGLPKQVAVLPEGENLAQADILLFLVSGDLTDSELQQVQGLVREHHRVVLLFNQQDRYLPEERTTLLGQLQDRVEGLIAKEDVLAIAANPAPVKVRQQQANGSLHEFLEQPLPEIAPLLERLQGIMTKELQALVQATTWREAQGVKGDAKEILNEIRRDRALVIIEKYQWLSAATAFANPVVALDLLATVAINGQLIIDLGKVYHQQISLSQAQNAAQTLGKLMVKLGLVELSTQALTSILKSNAITYAAGGAVQGVSAAYLTRIAGLSLIDYFQEQDPTLPSSSLNLEGWGQRLQTIFSQTQRGTFLRGFAQQATDKITASVN
jgi:uncharacterized protein (DUF697 family)